MKRLKRLLPAAFLLLATALAYDFGALQPQGYVSDFAQVVDPGSRAAIERYCAAVEKATGAQMAFVTLPSLQGEPVEDVANTLFRKWGIGQKGKNEGVLFLIAVGDRRTRLEVGYGLEPVIPDGAAGSILRAMRPLLRENRYGPALLEAAHGIGSRIAQAKNVTLAEAPRRPQRSSRTQIPIGLVSMGVVFAVFLFQTLRHPGRRRAGYGAPVWYAGDWGGSHRGGGGFGGYDSSDSFGGFGGGDSGGGGASSDW